jgi:hypothetical protein
MSLAATLCERIAAVRYEDLPSETLTGARLWRVFQTVSSRPPGRSPRYSQPGGFFHRAGEASVLFPMGPLVNPA